MGVSPAIDLAERPDISALVAVNDPLLAPLIGAATDEAQAGALEAIVISHARPIIDKVLWQYRGSDRFLSAEDADDIASTVMLRIVTRLQGVPWCRKEAIGRLADFTATLTYNAIYDVMRERFPEWTRLKNRVRYVLSRDNRFRLWSVRAGVVCELASGAGGPIADLTTTTIPEGRWRADSDRLSEAIDAILHAAGKPVLLGDLVGFLDDIWKISSTRTQALSAPSENGTHAQQVERRDYIQTLWREIRELQLQHRVALLLNLRDAEGGSPIASFVQMGVVSLNELADAVALPPDRLASLWNELPLDDLSIGSMLGVTRQQVINLRRTARERLTRRMSER